MFVMTSEINVGEYKVKPASVKWECSVSNFVDTCSIQLPASVYVPNTLSGTETPDGFKKSRFMPFKEGDAVSVALGYDKDNKTVFKGFLKRINFAVPLTLECEGYSYLLSDVYFTKSYARTTLKNLLKDLTSGTAIKLSEYVPDIPLTNLTFRNYPGTSVLEWLQKELLASVYFDFDKLYAGASRYGVKKGSQKLRLGWNTVEDKDLKKSDKKTKIKVEIVTKNPDGETKKTKSETQKYNASKEVKIRSGLPSAFVNSIKDELQRLEDYKGYSGNIVCFLQPFFEKSMVAEISDNRYPERAGTFFVETVDGSFDKSGGRQKITVNFFGDVHRK